MMDISRIKNKLNACVVKKCKGASGNCSMSSAPGVTNISLDCDLLIKSRLFKELNFTHNKINDCFLIEDDGVPRIGVIEFKGKRYDETRALKQLMSGKQIALMLVSSYGLKNSEIYLIIVSRRHHPSSKRILLRKFRQAGVGESRVLMAGCNDTFSDVRKRLRNF